MSFYVTLPSDSSLNFFPENKISHFITRLLVPIELKGEWEVSLTEFLYPHTWYNVTRKNNLFGYVLTEGGKELGRRIPEGFYETVPDILKSMKVVEQLNKIDFDFNNASKRVSIKVKNKAKLILHDGFAQTLGFKSTEISSLDSQRLTLFGELPADPSIHFRVLFLYTDIVEPQVVGDSLAPLLRMVNVCGTDGEMIIEQFDRPHYLPVNRKTINSIEIVIRNHLGDLISFQRGRSYVKLHFRQKYLS